ncbi:site-specific integrase [Aliiroseovarius sp. M344]|uniref:site-specific integrase n=1 Tax=Aliiroseovarius sp. M344 TaxID=2867010 RepID=UPI0021AD70BF|nr:site-specific integrase [Aliiroseovarius sp. M344]UWQ13070.1 site-specific integrase [Aliiroseovarius sp. M344]
MGTVTERFKKNGKPSYTAQLRKKKKGKVILNLVETFPSQRAAENWLKNQERALKKPGALDRAVNAKRRKDVSACVQDYIDSSPDGFGSSKSQMLSYFQRLPFGEAEMETLAAEDFVRLATDLLNGVQARPTDPELDTPEHYSFKPRKPQTVNGYLVTLGAVIRFGGPIAGVEMPLAEYEQAMRTLRHQKIVTKSAKRDRRPSLTELNKLMDHFAKRYQENPRCVPMHKIVPAAIFKVHRRGSILSQLWDDYDGEYGELTVRNLKHPRKTEGNDKVLTIRQEAMAIIDSMPRIDERIFPYHEDTITRLFTEACKLLGIENLRFHDLRHEGISRLFEIGLKIHEVAEVSGHEDWGSIKRYTHIKERGDKYEGWKWWPIVTSPLPMK